MLGNQMDLHPKRFTLPRLGLNFHTFAPFVLLFLFLPFQLSNNSNGWLSELYYTFGLSTDGFLDKGHIWQLLSHPLLHGNFFHWLTNALFLYYFGGRIHDILGEREVWRIALYSTLLGGVLHLLLQGTYSLVGASGIGMGLFAALATISPESKMFPLPLQARNLRNGCLISSLIFALMLPQLGVPIFHRLGEFLTPSGRTWLFSIGHGCHLGGMVAGYFTVRKFLRNPITLAQLQKERAQKEDSDAA